MARGVPGQANPYGPIYMIGSLLSAGLSIAILVIVNAYLCGSYCYYVGSSIVCIAYNVCYAQTPTSQGDINICYFSWAFGGIGLFLALIIFFMQVCSGRNRHIPACEVLVCIFSLLWWIACAVTTTVYGQNADGAVPPPGSSPNTIQNYEVLAEKTGWRTSVWAMSWANVGLWAILTVVCLKDCKSAKGQAPPTPAEAGGYPTGAYAQPVYQPQYQPQPGYYATAPAAGVGYGAVPAPPAYGYQQTAPAPGYPPASPFAGGQSAAPPAGYPPAN